MSLDSSLDRWPFLATCTSPSKRKSRSTCGPQQHDFLDLCEQSQLLALCPISWFRSHWWGQSVTPYPQALIGRVSCVLLPHARHPSRLLHWLGGILPAENSFVHPHVWWPCQLPSAQNLESPACPSWWILYTERTSFGLHKGERWRHNPSANSPSKWPFFRGHLSPSSFWLSSSSPLIRWREWLYCPWLWLRSQCFPS